MVAPAQVVVPGTVGMLASAPLWAQKMAERRALLAKNLNDSYALVVDYVESMMIELEGEKEAAIRLIALEQARLEDERRQWEEDKVRMAAVQQFASNKVRLNIGGQIFETTRSTLLKDPDHMLARMFSGRFEVTRDEHDAVFIDRDSSVFGLVLNFLRSNELSVSPREEGTLWKLLEEAKFYQIQPLVDCVKDKLGMRYVWYADWQQVCNSTEKFYQSPIFIVGGWPWRLSLVRDEGWLGISLTVSKRARQLPKGWRMNASFAVDIKNADPKKVSASMQHSDAQLDEARTGIFWRHCYELEKLALDGVIADDKLIISAEIKIESCTLLD